MVDLSIDSFKAKLVGGGARSNLFRATVNFPAFAQGDTELTSFMIKNASFPDSTTTPVEVAFRGRTIPLEGDRQYQAMSFTVYNDVKHPIRTAFIRWKDYMSNHSGNTGTSNPSEYMADFSVEQLDKSGNVTVTYNFVGAWPENVSSIDLSYDQGSNVQEFTVSMRYMYWRLNGVTQ